MMKGNNFMKIKRLFVLILTVALVLAMTACGAATEETTAAPENTTAAPESTTAAPADDNENADALGEYYMVTFASGIDYWKGCFEGYEKAANAVGATAVYTGTPEADFASEVDVFEQVVAKNPKGIALTCVDPDAFAEPINEAIEKGIPVVTFDSDSPGSNRYSYLGTGNVAAGAAAAAYMADYIGGSGEVGIVYFTGSQNQEERASGFEQYMETYYPDITVVQKAHGGDDETSSSAAASAMISANPNIKGIFGSILWH